MQVVIITEAGTKKGFGHIVRCISLYDALCAKNCSVTLILDCDIDIKNMIQERNVIFADWLKNPDSALPYLADADCAIIDSYHANSDFYRLLVHKNISGVFFDDYRRLDYPEGIIINSSPAAYELHYSDDKKHRYILGKEYIHLRKEFWNCSEKKITDIVRNIFVSFGGDDIRDMIPKVLKICRNVFPKASRKVILGDTQKNALLMHKFSDSDTEFFLSPAAGKIKEIMEESDIAVSAAGLTLYELAVTGTPVVTVLVADNQYNYINGILPAGFVEYAGAWDDADIENKTADKLKLLENPEQRRKRSYAGKQFIDGKGALRIAEQIIKYYEEKISAHI